MEDEQQHQQQEKPVTKNRGCLYAAIIALFLLTFILLGFLASLKGFFAVTDKAPVPLPTVKMSAQEMAAVRQRVDAFREAVRNGTTTNSLTLSADELNALIQTDQDLDPLKGKLYVADITTNGLRVQFTVSMAQLGATKFKDRYFNGFAVVQPVLSRGRLQLKPQSIVTLKGRQIPGQYLEVLKNVNFSKGLSGNPRFEVGLDWIKSVRTTDGKLVITPKEKGP